MCGAYRKESFRVDDSENITWPKPLIEQFSWNNIEESHRVIIEIVVIVVVWEAFKFGILKKMINRQSLRQYLQVPFVQPSRWTSMYSTGKMWES